MLLEVSIIIGVVVVAVLLTQDEGEDNWKRIAIPRVTPQKTVKLRSVSRVTNIFFASLLSFCS